ncbi:hypothetical protein D3C85_1417770 [compost metagenome]
MNGARLYQLQRGPLVTQQLVGVDLQLVATLGRLLQLGAEVGQCLVLRVVLRLIKRGFQYDLFGLALVVAAAGQQQGSHDGRSH